MRKIPSVMFTQHPDHARKPYWLNTAFVKTHHEIKECYLMFKELGAEEMMWDWEGKLVDESVYEKLLVDYYDFFKNNLLGKDIFLTFRIPNPKVESEFRWAKALIAIISSFNLAKKLGFSEAPIFEVILPLAESAEDIINVQKAYLKLADAFSTSFGTKLPFANINVIPIFESIEVILSSEKILSEYLKSYQNEFGDQPEYLRPFLARSDPALKCGIVATTLAIKSALSDINEFSKRTGTICHPILASGALPFRGGLTPQTVEHFFNTFIDFDTIVIQSAFRYDYPKEQVQKAIVQIKKLLEQKKSLVYPPEVKEDLKKLIPLFSQPYQETVKLLAAPINECVQHVPQRRERLRNFGVLSYSRSLGEIKLPRAIGFAASCYSLGIPPEIFGVAQGLRQARRLGFKNLLMNLYPTLQNDLQRAARYLRRESLKNFGLTQVEKELAVLEKELNIEFAPKTAQEREHQELSGRIIEKMEKKQSPSREIEQAAMIRKSMG